MEKTTKTRLLLGLLILSSLFGYLEWGQNNSSFLFEVEGEILFKVFLNPLEVIHPLVIVPLIGQLLLLIALFQKQPSKKLIYAGILCLALLFVLILLVGFLALNFWIILSTIPFFTLSIITFLQLRKKHELNRLGLLLRA